VPVAAVALGAHLIEKHLTLSRATPGPDSAFSLEPAEFKRMVADIRALSQALGDGRKAPQVSEWDTRRAARQQVVAARDIAAGAVFQRTDLTTSRAGRGRPAMALWPTVGQQAERAYRAGEAIDP